MEEIGWKNAHKYRYTTEKKGIRVCEKRKKKNMELRQTRKKGNLKLHERIVQKRGGINYEIRGKVKKQ